MQGLIFKELKEYVRKKLGMESWDEVRKDAGVNTTLYNSAQVYPDTELIALFTKSAERLGLPVQSMLEEFGKYFTQVFFRTRLHFIDPQWDYLTLVEHGPEILKQMEKRHTPNSPPASLRVTRDSPEQVTMTYSSPRRLCSFVRGMLKGVAKQYHVEITIEEPRCMLKGQAECVYVVRVVGSTKQSKEASESKE